jgi:hypothetical protein
MLPSVRWAVPTDAVLLGTLLAAAVGLAGCGCGGGCVGGTHPRIPDWYLNAPEGPNNLYAARSVADEQMRAAIDAATTAARQDLAARIDTTLKSYTHAFIDTLDGTRGEQAVNARREARGTLIETATPEEKTVYQQDDGSWRAFVLVKTPVTDVARALLTQLQKQEALYTRFRASAAYQEVAEAANKPEEEAQER